MKAIVRRQEQTIDSLKQMITSFCSSGQRTRIIPLAIPTGWGKTRIALQAILRAKYGKSTPVVVIWPQNHQTLNQVWKRRSDWCKNHRYEDCHCDDFDHPTIAAIGRRRRGPKEKRHEQGAGKFSPGFRGTFYSVNNRFGDLHRDLKRVKGPVLFVIDEWHTKGILKDFKEHDCAEKFWRERLLGKDAGGRKLFVLLVSATPIGATSEMDAINAEMNEDEPDDYENKIREDLDRFANLTRIGNQNREYSYHKTYKSLIEKEVQKLHHRLRENHHRCSRDDADAWGEEYVRTLRKAVKRFPGDGRSRTQIYYLESLLTAGVAKKNLCSGSPAVKRVFRSGLSKTRSTKKLLSCLEILKENSDQKFVIFCHFKAVARTLNDFLIKNGIKSHYLAGEIGVGTSENDRFAQFVEKDNPHTMALIVTDKHSQGISMHESEAWLIHFELSWNPIRIIQRFGRVWRLQKDGSLSRPVAFHIPHTLSAEEEMLRRLELRWQTLEELSGTELAGYLNLAPIPYGTALGIRWSPETPGLTGSLKRNNRD